MNLYPLRLLLLAAICGSIAASGQEIPYKQFAATPLLLNPALAGSFDGNLRGNIAYRRLWTGAEAPFSSVHASADAPVYTGKKGDYFGAGLALTQSKSGDGILNIVNGVVGASYHKRFGSDSARAKGKGSELAIGLQGSYAQYYMDMFRMYFAGPPTTAPYVLGTGNSVSSYLVNAGITYSRSVSKELGYVVGFSASNLNGAGDALLERQRSLVGLDRKYTFLAGGHIAVGERMLLRPALVYATRESTYFGVRYVGYIVGNEFMYGFTPTSSMFFGLWYSKGDLMTVSAGLKKGSVRVGLAYDYNMSALNAAANGTGGFEIALTYINPSVKAGHRYVPCARF